MKLAEHILLDNIYTQLIAHLNPPQLVFISNAYSKEFYETIQTFRHDLTYVYGDILEQKSKQFNVIVDWLDAIESSGDVIKYRPYLAEGGSLVLGVPSQSLLQNKEPRYSILNKKSDVTLSKAGFTPIFHEPVGKLLYLHRLPKSDRLFMKIGKFFPNSKLYSPYILCIYSFTSKPSSYTPYVASHTLTKRLSRVRERTTHKIRNHKVNDYIVKVERAFTAAGRPIKSVFLVHRYNFKKYIIPKIPTTEKKQNKKILVIAMTYLQIGGVERVMLNLVKGIDRSKFTIHIITTVPSKNDWHTMFSNYVDSITHIPDILDNHWPESYRRHYLEEYVIRNNTDVLFITNSATAYHALPKIKLKLTDVTIYDLLHTHGTPRDHDAYLRISMPFDKYINRRIVIDEYLKNYYCNKYPVDPSKVSVIYNSLDSKTLDFRFSSKDREAFFTVIPDDKKIITYIGRLEFDKSPLRLVAIAAILKQRSIPACIVVIGDGSLMEPMLQQAKKLSVLNEYIYFYGSSNAPLAQMAQSDFTLLVSNSEGIPMSILESMSVHVPPISSAVGGVPEMISDTIDGLLVNILDTDDEDTRVARFTDKIEVAVRLSNEQYESMSKAARQKVVEKFSSMADMYEHLFETGKVK